MSKKKAKMGFWIYDKDTKLFLEGFDGDRYEWTDKQETSWKFDVFKEAKSRLMLVQKEHPRARIV